MNDEKLTFETKNLLTKKVRLVTLVPSIIERVVDEDYALAIYPKDTGDFLLWPEPIYLFDEQKLNNKIREYKDVKKMMLDNENKRLNKNMTTKEISHLDFEWFGYYQTGTNDALMIDQWTITNETRQALTNAFKNWQIIIEKQKGH